MWSVWQSRKMGRRVAGLLGGLLVGLLLVAAPAAAAFVDPINLSNSSLRSAVNSGRPAIAVNEVNGTPYVFAVWEEGINGQTNIVFARSQPGLASCGGLQFGAPRILSAGPGASMPAVAANNSRGVFVVWQASSDVWMSRSADNGETFLPPENLSNDATPSNSPSVATDEFGGIFVAWSDGSSPAQILFKRSTAGSGFDQAVRVSQTPSGRTSQAPAVAAGGGHVFLVWKEGFGLAFLSSNIRYKKFGRSDALTPGFGFDAVDLSSDPSTPFLFRVTSPSLAFRDNVLSVAFANFNAVYHRSSSNAPDFNVFSELQPSFSGPVEVRGSARGARRNASAIVTWAEKTLEGSTDIWHRLVGSTNGPEPVLTTAAKRESPAAAIDSTGRLLVAWQGRETPDLPNDEIYLSYNGGTGGGTPMNVLVEMRPQTLNAKTMYQGEGVFTLRIRFLDGNAVDYPLSLTLNDHPVTPLRSSLVDTDGNGTPDTLELKIKRSELQGVFADVKVKGNMTGGRCFSGKGDVRIIHQ